MQFTVCSQNSSLVNKFWVCLKSPEYSTDFQIIGIANIIAHFKMTIMNAYPIKINVSIPV